MTLSTYITNDKIAVLIVYLVSLTGGLIWSLYRIYVLEKREKLWRELVKVHEKLEFLYASELHWFDPVKRSGYFIPNRSNFKSKESQLKQQLYDANS